MASRNRPETFIKALPPALPVFSENSTLGRLTFNYIIYNPKTNEVGVPFFYNGFWLVDIGALGSKPFTNTWCVVGDL